MATNSSELDCTCPVCCDIFKDPVILLCGHSFCQHCLQEWWRQSELQTCPVCKEIFQMAQPPRNLALRDLSDTLRREKSQRANPGSKEICNLHGEKLRLFCQDDQQLICLVCRDAQRHKKHNFIPIDEAAKSFRAHLSLNKLHLKTKLGSFEAEKSLCDKMAAHIKLQAQQTEKSIKEEFQKLYHFLHAEETARINAVRTEAMLKNQTINVRIVNLTAEINSLTDKIKTLQSETKAEDVAFMLNVKSLVERTQCNLPEPESLSDALIDEAKHLGNLLFTVWLRMKNLISYTPVTLDPNTGSTSLSENMTRSTESYKSQPLPLNPERLHNLNVLGSKGFNSGKHSWDVDVEVRKWWNVGVAVKKTCRSSVKSWGLGNHGGDILLEISPQGDKRLDGDSHPEKIRVQLDYDQGILSFFDLVRKSPLHTIKHTFTGTVFPYFIGNVKIHPAELSVGIKTK